MPATIEHSVRIDYDDHGSGEPAVLLTPGWCCDRTMFFRLARLLQRRRRVLALDWRGHGRSAPASGDFGERELVDDALAVIRASGAERIIPVAVNHSGWVALELRRQLGERIPAVVLLDWIVLDAPPALMEILEGLQHTDTWLESRERLFDAWTDGATNETLWRYVHEAMSSRDRVMWARAGREIAGAYARHGSPLAAYSALDPPVPVLHLYAQPDSPEYLAEQRAFAARQAWFSVSRLEAHSCLSMFEAPEDIAVAIDGFVDETSAIAA